MADSKKLQQITAQALLQVPAFLKQGLDTNSLNVVQGKPTQGYGHKDAIASVPDDKPNTIIIHNIDKFSRPGAASQVLAHELTHRLTDQVSPTIKFAPVNSTAPYDYDSNNLATKKVTDFSPEQLAAMVQTNTAYQIDPNISAQRKQQVAAQYAPIIQQLQQLPQATVNTDQSGQSGSTINTTPNAPQGQMFDSRLVKAHKKERQKYDAMPDVVANPQMDAPTTQPQLSANATSIMSRFAASSPTSDQTPATEQASAPVTDEAPSTSAPKLSSNAASILARMNAPQSASAASSTQKPTPAMSPSQNPTLPHKLPPGVSDLVQTTAAKYGIDPNLISGVIRVESSGNPNAKASTTSASGLMQLTKGTASDMGVKDVFDPAQNIEGGTKYLSKMIALHGGNVKEGLAAYYGSPNRAANLAYADRVLNAAGPSLSEPSNMSSQAGSSDAKSGSQLSDSAQGILARMKQVTAATDQSQSYTPPPAGTIVHVNGHAGTVTGYNKDSGKVSVDMGSMHLNPFTKAAANINEVSPQDIDASPSRLSSVIGGSGNALVHGVQRVEDVDPSATPQQRQALSDSQTQLTSARDANPLEGALGEAAGVAIPALATGVPQAVGRVGLAGVQGISEGAMQELAAHGIGRKELIGALMRKGVKGEILDRFGEALGIPRAKMRLIELGASTVL